MWQVQKAIKGEGWRSRYANKMKAIVAILMLPLMALGCLQWKIGEGKNFYVTPSYTMLQINEGNHERLYQMRNIDVKGLACMSKALNTTLNIDGVPEFSRREAAAICTIPDYCFKKRKPKVYEIPDNEPRVIVSEL